MTLSKLLKILIVLLIVFAVSVGLTSINHPVILKWLAGSARHIGKPISASVYTNEQINHKIKAFHVDRYWDSGNKANDYLLSLSKYDSLEELSFFNINLDEKWIGRLVGTSNRDYDYCGTFISKRNRRTLFSISGRHERFQL